MSSNQTIAGQNGGDGDNDTQIALVALVVSVVALVGTLLQVGQQYLASAAGYSNCDESVIGPWHKTKKRQFRYSEMRFRVLFKSPVFFVCAADNEKGPVKGALIYFVDGTPQGVQKTLSLPVQPPSVPENADGKPVDAAAAPVGTGIITNATGLVRKRYWPFGKHRGHDAKGKSARDVEGNDNDDNNSDDNDAATTVPTNTGDNKGVHTVDSEMATWVHLLQECHRMEMHSRLWQEEQVKLSTYRHLQPYNFETHKLCVAIQSKQLSWDTMPTSINRPYATTTLCHMIEMAAMLGIYWREFDKAIRNCRAEGNGYVLSGSRVADSGGIFFTFQISGKNRFEENRIIPGDEVKEFAFGLVPTIFRETEDRRRLSFSVDDVHTLGTLLLGSRRQFGETLASIGCNTYSSNCLRNEGARYGHLFSLSFEVMGMVGMKLHRKGSVFRFLPNPTYSHWDKKYFDMNLLLRAYNVEIQKLDNLDVQKDGGSARSMQSVRLPWLKAAAANIDKVIAGNAGGATVDFALMDLLNRTIRVCDGFLRVKGRKKVGLVLCQHIQQVLYMVNGKSQRKSEDGTAITTSHYDDLMAANPGNRQKLLMEIYFDDLRGCVVEKVRSAGTMADVPVPVAMDKSWANDVEPLAEPLTPEERVFAETSAPLTDELEAEALWCTLVLRMLCWLTLHDFNKADVQFERDELLGSRLSVFIR